MNDDIQLVVVGSIGLDTIETPLDSRKDILGGSCTYACTASSFFTHTGMVGIVGDDFPSECIDLYRKSGIDLKGLQTVAGKTFRWNGVYDRDMINRRTISTDLNVFESFSPKLPEKYQNTPFLLLGNIMPDLQLQVLSQVNDLKFVVADTMDLWINIALDPLMDVISGVNMLTLNDSEARLLTGEHNLRKCADIILDMGPEYLVIKKGEHGAMLVSSSGIFLLPAYPVEAVVDPTGAGDSFAGALIGYLAECGSVSDANVRKGLLYGSVVASFGVQDFSLDSFAGLTHDTIENRLSELMNMISV